MPKRPRHVCFVMVPWRVFETCVRHAVKVLSGCRKTLQERIPWIFKIRQFFASDMFARAHLMFMNGRNMMQAMEIFHFGFNLKRWPLF